MRRKHIRPQSLTAAPFWVGESDVTAGTGRVLLGSLGREQIVNLSVQRLDGGIHLVVLGPERGLVSSVLIIATGGVISTTRWARGSGKTRSSGRTLCSSTPQTECIAITREFVFLYFCHMLRCVYIYLQLVQHVLEVHGVQRVQ